MKRITLLRILILAVLLSSLLISGNAFAADQLKVVTTISDLASITKEVGGDKVDAQSIARGYQDPHFVEAKPSFLLLLKDADLLEVGAAFNCTRAPQPAWLRSFAPATGSRRY